MLRLVISNQTNPYWNVAVENYLLSLPETNCVTMYLWKNHRTVVIGQNQNPFAECNVDLLNREGGYVMRRSTGGGAVYHDDGNINFSFIAPHALYDQSRQFEVIRQAVAQYGLNAELSGRNDLLCEGRKFSGNAFSKSKFQNLHHGTILIKGNMDDLKRYLRVRPAKLQKHGVQSVQSRVVNLSELAEVTSLNIVPHLVGAFENVYGEKSFMLDFDQMISRDEVRDLYNKFSSDAWLYGRWRTFSAQKSAQFEWGGVDLALDIDEERSVIRNVTMATDCLSTDVVNRIESLLRNASTIHAPEIPEGSQKAIIEDIFSLIY